MHGEQDPSRHTRCAGHTRNRNLGPISSLSRCTGVDGCHGEADRDRTLTVLHNKLSPKHPSSPRPWSLRKFSLGHPQGPMPTSHCGNSMEAPQHGGPHPELRALQPVQEDSCPRCGERTQRDPCSPVPCSAAHTARCGAAVSVGGEQAEEVMCEGRLNPGHLQGAPGGHHARRTCLRTNPVCLTHCGI